MQHKIKLLNKEQDWSRLKNYRPNEVVNHNGKQWQNVTGLNSEPSESSFDWVNIDFNKGIDNALIKPEDDGNLDDFPYVVGVDREGDTAFLPANSFGKVKTVNGQEPDENGDIPLDLDYIPLSGTVEGKPLTGTIEFSNTSVPILKGSISAGKDFSIKQDSENNLHTTVSGDGNYSLLHQHKDGILLGTVVKGDITSNLGISVNSIVLFSPGDINTRGAITGASDYSNYLSTNKLLYAQRIYVDKAIGNFKLPTNWESPQQRFSGLEDKSNDATYNKVMVLDGEGKAGTKNLDYAVPYVGANKPIDLNTQRLTIGGDFDKSYSTFERSQLNPNETGTTHFTRLTDVASLSRGSDSATQSDCIVIRLPIKASTRWVMEVDIFSPNTASMFNGAPEKLIIGAHGTSNDNISVNAISGADNVKSVSFGRDANNNTVIIIRPSDDSTKFQYGKVNIANFYHSVIYNEALAVKSNYKVEAVLESSLTGLTTNGTVANAKFNRDSYYLDFRNFTNVPNFAQASNVFAKNEATNWTNENQQWSGLVDKSADATYDKVMVLDADGKAGMKNLNADTLIDILESATPEQLTQIKTLLGL